MDQHTANLLRRAACALLTLALLSLWAARAEARDAAEVVVLHGKVYTVDAHRPWAQAVAVRNGKIVDWRSVIGARWLLNAPSFVGGIVSWDPVVTLQSVP